MLEILERFFSYRLEKLGNVNGYTITVWNEYGLSIRVAGGTENDAMNKLKLAVELEIWS